MLTENKSLDNKSVNNSTENSDIKVAEKVADYKQKLESLKTKPKLDEADRNLIKEARSFAETLKSKQEATEINQSQSQELLDLLSKLNDSSIEIKTNSGEQRDDLAQKVATKQEEKSETFKNEAIAITSFLGEKEYFEDINLSSAVLIITKISGTDYKDYADAGYKTDGFFGPTELSNLNKFKAEYDSNTEFKQKVDKISKWKNNSYDLLNVINSISTIEKNGESKVLESLCDLNGDGKIDITDNGLISGKEVFDLINKNPKEEGQIIKSISDVLGINFSDKAGLYKALKADPTLKYDFFSKLYFLAMAGVNLKDTLLKGKSGITKSVENMGENLLVGDNLTEALIPGFSKEYDKAISELEKKLENPLLSIEDRNKLTELISIYKGPENKQKFLEAFKMNSAGLLLSLVKDNRGFGGGISISNGVINKSLQEASSKLINGMQINLGFTMASGNFLPGIGVNFSSRDLEMSENTKAGFNAGLFLTIPYLTGTLNYNYNSDDINKAGLQDFSESFKKIGITGNVSTLANGLTLHWSKDKIEAIEKKEKQFSNLLDELFTGDFDAVGAIMTLEGNKDLSKEDKTYIQQFIKKIQNALFLIGYDKLKDGHKKIAITGVKYALLNEWKTGLFMQAQKDGTEFSGIGVGLQFVAGLLPIFTAGVRFTDYKTSFTKDTQGEVLQAMSSDKLGKSKTTEATKLSGDEIVKGLNDFKNEELDKYLTENQNRMVGLAQRNPRDYPKFLQYLTSGDYTNALISLQRILKTDPIIKKDVYIKNLSKSLNSFNDMQKAYILAQFMDSIFKDKNTISQVLSSNPLWNDREKGLKKVYVNENGKTDKEVYSQVISLRNKIRANVGVNPTPTQEKGIMGFVASYKITWTKDGNKKSLGKGEAAIPPGLATVVGGPNGIEKITDDKALVQHTINDLKKTPFYNTLSSSLEKIIVAKYPDFKFEKNTFEEFLKTGMLKVGDKTIKLDRDFVFFLYGKCANETFGLKINGIDLGDGITQPLELNPTGEINIYMPGIETTDYTIGVLGGGGEKPKPTTPTPPEDSPETTPENSPEVTTPPETTPPETTPPETTPPETTPPENTPEVTTTTPENTSESTGVPGQGDN